MYYKKQANLEVWNMSTNQLTLTYPGQTPDQMANYYLSVLTKKQTALELYYEQVFRYRKLQRAELHLRKYKQANQLRSMQSTSAVGRALKSIFGKRLSA